MLRLSVLVALTSLFLQKNMCLQTKIRCIRKFDNSFIQNKKSPRKFLFIPYLKKQR